VTFVRPFIQKRGHTQYFACRSF